MIACMGEGRNVNVAPEVATLLPEAQLAHMLSLADDEDNRCAICDRFIEGDTVDVVAFQLGGLIYVRFTHPECLRTGVYDGPQTASGAFVQQTLALGAPTRTAIGIRDASPRALVFVELLLSVSTPDSPDPYSAYAELLGLHPITDELESMMPETAGENVELRVAGDVLVLSHRAGEDQIAPPPAELPGWMSIAEREGFAFLIAGYGLSLDRSTGAVQDALRVRPAWGAAVPVHNRGT